MSRSIRHHLHLHTAGPPPPLALFSARPLISILPLSLSLSICLVNMCKQTSRGIDKTHPGVFTSASSGQNITPPPLKIISSVVFFPKRDLGDRLLPPSRVHSLYLVSSFLSLRPVISVITSFISLLRILASLVFPLHSSVSFCLASSTRLLPFVPSPRHFLPHLLHFISTLLLFLSPPSFPCVRVSL